jgi:hypothetical protein
MVTDMLEKNKINNIKPKPLDNSREVLFLIINQIPTISNISDIDENGHIKFETPLSSLGFNVYDFNKYNSEIMSNFMADFMGEYIIRENINVFLDKLIRLNHINYSNVVNKLEHKRFGMKVNKVNKTLSFRFHISLLENILTEDFKYKVI